MIMMHRCWQAQLYCCGLYGIDKASKVLDINILESEYEPKNPEAAA